MHYSAHYGTNWVGLDRGSDLPGTVAVFPGYVHFSQLDNQTPFSEATVHIDVDRERVRVFVSDVSLTSKVAPGATGDGMAKWMPALGMNAVRFLTVEAQRRPGQTPVPSGLPGWPGARHPDSKTVRYIMQGSPSPKASTLEKLAKVAAIYREADAAGESTGKAVMKELGVKHDAARRRIGRARAAGLLPPL